ncbi:uncharacterized protein isoform X2 [Rhodnius prolixus]|uniref:uncharacterized protein isoform X2 n=1 Tax=Rhodnius prolixus TaxID=13249 RepID=UPI003D18E78C
MDVTALTNSEVLMNFAHIIKLTWRYTKMKIMLFVSGIFEVFFLEDEKKFENERHRLMNIMLTDHSSHGKKRNVHDISETRNPNPSYIDDITDLAGNHESILDDNLEYSSSYDHSLPIIIALAKEEKRKSLELMKNSWKNYDPISFVEHLIGKNRARFLLKNKDYLGLYRTVILFTDDPIIQAELKGMNDISLSIKLLNLEKRFLQLLSS